MTTTAKPADPYPVLVVEDNHLLCRVLQDCLSDAGYSSVCVGNGREAVAKLEQDHFPIVITDLMMPDMDGLELCRTIRSRFTDHYIYTILLTSKSTKEDLIEGLEAGADEYLIKPVEDAELKARLKIARRILELESSLKKSLEELKHLSVKDPLTGFYNRRHMVERLPQEIKRSDRYDRPLSIVMFDLDRFKKINDSYGHPVGDRVLQACSDCVREMVREDLDWTVRYGGEEFVVVLPETPFSGAMVAAERLRECIARRDVKADGHSIATTASFGVASLPDFPRKERLAMETLIECADRCLYRAKKGGRNLVIGEQL